MDRMLYVAMTGAKETLRAQTVNNHNLANVSTTAFAPTSRRSRAAPSTVRATPRACTPPTPPRASNDQTGALLLHGPRSRHRDQRPGMDRGAGRGWQGSLIRAAGDSAGVMPPASLMTANGRPFIGDGGPDQHSPFTLHLLRARADRVSVVAQGQNPDTTATVARIKARESAGMGRSRAVTMACSA
jgi:flagellar basal-body rod protein FlgF